MHPLQLTDEVLLDNRLITTTIIVCIAEAWLIYCCYKRLYAAIRQRS